MIFLISLLTGLFSFFFFVLLLVFFFPFFLGLADELELIALSDGVCMWLREEYSFIINPANKYFKQC